MDSLNRGAFNLVSEPLFSLSHGLWDLRPRLNLKEFLSPFSNASCDLKTPFPGLTASIAATGESSLVPNIVKISSIAAIGGLSYLAWKKYGRKMFSSLCGEREPGAVYGRNHGVDIGGGGDILAPAAARDAEDVARDAEFAEYDAARAALARRMAAINALADDIHGARAQAAYVADPNDDDEDDDEWSDEDVPEMHVVCEGGDNRGGETDDYAEYFRLYPDGMFSAMGKGDADLVFDYLDEVDDDDYDEDVDDAVVDGNDDELD